MDLLAQTPVSMAFEDVEALLRPLVEQKVQQQQQQQQGPAAAADLDAVFASLRRHLEAHTRGFEEDALAAAPGVPLAEVDAQLGPLQAEVEAVVARLAQHRAHVPAVVAAALERQLQQLRPADTAEPADQAAATPHAAGEDGAAQLQQAQQMHERLQAALNKLPALRARLEEVEQRLGRNLAAVDAAHAAAAQPPRTVERVLRGVAARADGGADPAPLGGAAMDEDGA